MVRDDLLELLQDQQELLDGLLADHQSLLDKFVEAEAAAKELVVVRDRFADYISERVLWLRSASLFDKDDTLAVAAAVRHLGDPEQWKSVGPIPLERRQGESAHLGGAPDLAASFGSVAMNGCVAD